MFYKGSKAYIYTSLENSNVETISTIHTNNVRPMPSWEAKVAVAVASKTTTFALSVVKANKSLALYSLEAETLNIAL